MLGIFIKPLGNSGNIPANLVATVLAVGSWGYFLYTGVTDPLGGINSLWPLFGIGNQMLAGIALIMVSVVLVKMKKDRFVWVSLIPALGLLVVTTVACLQKLFESDTRVSFIAHAAQYREAAAAGKILSPAKDLAQMNQIVLNDYVNSGLAVAFLAVVLFIAV